MIVQQKAIFAVPDADPYFASVVALYHFDDPAFGAGGSTAAGGSGYLFDSSSKARHVSVHNSTNTYKNNVTSKMGVGALRQVGGDYTILPTSSDWVFGTADFTIEVWVLNGFTRSDGLTVTSTDDAAIVSWMPQANATTTGICFAVHRTGIGLHSSWNANSRPYTGGTSNGSGNWDFYSISRLSGAWYAHMNGVLLTAGTGTGDGVPASRNITSNGQGCILNFFNTTTVAASLIGYIDDLRITKGVGRYGNANYAVPTKPFPNYGP